mgnify:CR=1 FL=1
MKALYTAAFASIVATAAPAATFDFTGDICNGGLACANSNQIDQTYGDMVGVDAVYDRDISTAAKDNVLYWGTGYEEFSSVIWTDLSTKVMSISLIAMAGYEVTLSSLGIAPYLNRNANPQLQIVDLATASDIYNMNFTPISTDGSTTISPNATSEAGFEIIFGPDAYNSGIGFLTYDAQLIADTPAVPLPAAGWMLIAGIGGLMAARRKRG